MSSQAAALAHIVNWDIEFNRPLVDGNIAHPVTGEIIKGGRLGLKDGPPGVDIILFNINTDTKPLSIRATSPVPMAKVYLAVAKHVKDGIYKLVSVNASAYSFVIVCEIVVSAEEFNVAWQNRFSNLDSDS